LTVLTHYLRQAVACEVYLLGIQPRSVAFDTPLSPVVSTAVQTVTQFLLHLAALNIVKESAADAF
jgi:hypothetical protein